MHGGRRAYYTAVNLVYDYCVGTAVRAPFALGVVCNLQLPGLCHQVQHQIMVKFGQELGRHTATSPVGPEKYVDYSKIKKSLKQTDITNDKLQEMFEAEMNKVSETIAREPEILTSDPDYVTINEKALDKISKKIDKHRNLDRRTKNRELASSNLKQSLLGAGDTETVQIEQNADGDVNYTNPMADATIAEEVGDDAKEEVGGVAGVVQWFVEQKYFLAVVALAFLVALLTYQTLEVAMWVGVSFAAYSAVANDSNRAKYIIAELLWHTRMLIFYLLE